MFPEFCFGQNNGVIQLTGVAKCYVWDFVVALMLIVLGLFPAVSGFVQHGPGTGKLGGATLVMFGTIAASGVRIVSRELPNRRAILIIAPSLAVFRRLATAADPAVRAGMGEKSALIRNCRWRYHGYRVEFRILPPEKTKTSAAATRFAAAVTLFHHSYLEDLHAKSCINPLCAFHGMEDHEIGLCCFSTCRIACVVVIFGFYFRCKRASADHVSNWVSENSGYHSHST